MHITSVSFLLGVGMRKFKDAYVSGKREDYDVVTMMLTHEDYKAFVHDCIDVMISTSVRADDSLGKNSSGE